MINSRDINDLLPVVRAKAQALIDKCRESGIDLLITSTFRDMESQAAIYAQGRTSPGKIVTNARPGQSWHNWRCAFDVVPLVGGKAVWNDQKLWSSVGRLGRECGLEWAGDWKGFKEYAHFQFTGGLTLADLQAGKQIVG